MVQDKILAGIDLGPGRVVYDDFAVDWRKPLLAQVEVLKEDLLQIEFPRGVLVDVGWYPAFQESGHFQVRVVEGFAWDPPYWTSSAADLETLRRAVHMAVQVALRIAIDPDSPAAR